MHTAGECNALYTPAVALPRIHKIRENVDKLHLAFIRPVGGIGDMLMILPTIKAVRKKYNCYIDVITDFHYLDGALPKVLQGNPYIDNVIDHLDIKKPDYERYDGVIPLNCPCAWREVKGFKPVGRIDLFAQHTQIKLDDYRIDYYITNEEVSWAKEFLSSRRVGLGDKIVVCQVNSSTNMRDLPTEKYKQLISAITTQNKNTKVFIVTHGAKEVNWNIYGSFPFHNFDIRHIAALIHCSNLVICPDSSILHLAAALDKPTLTLFGPTDPHARVNTYPRAVAIDGAIDLACKNCWYSPSCSHAYPCWRRIDTDLIIETANLMLNNQEPSSHPAIVRYPNFQLVRNEFVSL
jgi:ADP-heptose:LPS heptosyltransferase